MGISLAPGISLKLHYDPDQLVTRFLLRRRVFEPWLTNFLILNLRPGQTVLNIGANVGYFTVLSAKLVGESGSVVAFEPLYASSLRRNLRLNGLKEQTSSSRGVSVREVALSDSPGVVPMLEQIDWFHASTLLPSGDLVKQLGGRSKVRAVDCRRLDSIVAGIAPNWIVMDAEGSEGRILSGAAEVMAVY